MEFAMAAVTSVLPKLDELLRGEYSLPEGARKLVELLRKELHEMQAGICDVSELRKDPLPHVAFTSLLEVSYDMEDTMDCFFVKKCSWPMLIARRRIQIIASKMIDLCCQIKISAREVKDRCSSHKIGYSGPSVDPRVVAMFKEASGLVGMERPRAELIRLLLMKGEEPESESRLKVVPIVGIGGLGKTTLAQVVYNATKEFFQCRAWVTVSQSPNMERILIDMLCQVKDPHSSGSSDVDGERDLISGTNKTLQGKRYLIVLDDLWSTGTLEIIKAALPLNNFGSRVILTTRNYSVAVACCSFWDGCIYNMLPLSSKDSWTLFNRRIFGENHCPTDFVDAVERILRKCSGIPLAIDSISGLLACKPHSRAAWDDLLNAIAPISGSLDVMTELLVLSYNDLPHHLRVCLMYLSIFPLDFYPIKCDRIVSCWVSEGLVLGNSVTTPEEAGQSCLTELINRSLIQPVYGIYDGKLEAIRIHDTVLDVSRSMSTKENFISILDKLRHPETVLAGNFRRLSIKNSNEEYCIPESVAKSPIHSLFIFGRVGRNISFKNFTLLRVLDLEGCKDLRDHNIIEITKLFHLRFLSIRDTPITGLPYQIGKLSLLKTLDLRGTKVQELPQSIVRLSMLAHLRCNKMRFPEGLGKMAALCCLSLFDILRSKLSVLAELGYLSELKELELCLFFDGELNKTEVYENLAISLYRLNKLQSLCIHGDGNLVDLLDHLQHPLKRIQSIQLNNSSYLNRIPSSFRSHASLEYASIGIKEVKSEDLKMLSELCLLQHLSLRSKAMPKEKLVIGGNGFPVLREFHLHSPRVDLTFEPQVMQKVDKLVVSSYLIPARICGIKHLRCLRVVYIRAPQVSEEATNIAIRSAADEHPNHPTVQITTMRDFVDYEAEGKFEENLEVIKDYNAKEGNELEQNLET